MRVALLNNFPVWSLPQAGADFLSQRHANSWLVELPEAFGGISGLETHWITLCDLIHQERRFEHQGNHFWVLPARKKGRASTLYWRDRRTLQEKIRHIRPDLVHGWGSEDVFGWAAVRSGYPHLLSMQGILTNLVHHGRLPLRTMVQAVLEWHILKKAATVSVESEWGRQKIRKIRGTKPTYLVEYGVQKIFFETAWRPKPTAPRCLFVGTLNEQKGIQDLTEAFRDPRLRDFELRVIGEGEPRWTQALQANASANVKWLGRKHPRDVAAEMAESWCLALPTRADTSPNVVKEARVVGLPVVTTFSGGQAAYVKSGEDGYLCAPGAVDDLANKIQGFLENFQKTVHAGDIGRERYREIFRPAKTTASFYEIYRQILERKRDP